MLKKINTPILLCLLFVVVISKRVMSQEGATLDIKLKLAIVDGDFKNALITITKNGAPYRVIDPDKGKYSITLELNANYLIECTKMGYISKSLTVSTHVPKGREEYEFIPYIITVTLNKQPEDQEITYNQPVGKIKFNPIDDEFSDDKDYAATATQMQKTAEANPKPKPKPPTPNPRITPPPPPPPPPPVVSNPEPVKIKQPEYKPEPPKPKIEAPKEETVYNPIVRNISEKVLQKDRVKITYVTVNINGVDYEYRKEEYAWGGVFYYKRQYNITGNTFEHESVK